MKRSQSLMIAVWCALILGGHTNSVAQQPAAVGPPLEFRDGERIVCLGGAFVERQQVHGYFESIMTTAYASKRLTFRNLGWSGDNLFGQARAVFGTPAEGFERLQKDLADARPTMVLICYGSNEAHAGAAGQAAFAEGLTRLLDLIESLDARAVLISPRRYEHIGPPLPDPQEYNEELEQYCRILRSTAAARELTYIDLFSWLGGRLTDNGLHLTPFGYWRMASRLSKTMGANTVPWYVDLSFRELAMTVSGASVDQVEREEHRLRIVLRDRQLPIPDPPDTAPRNAHLLVSQGTLRIRDLPAGQYEVRIDGQPVTTADHEALDYGIELPYRGGREQVERLRHAVIEKNTLYFHRYRPQNETYLFLFRKHEQGNNAVEIPQFDPLIEELEQRIHDLAVPAAHVYEVVRLQTASR